jgi:hypothetical protein
MVTLKCCQDTQQRRSEIKSFILNRHGMDILPINENNFVTELNGIAKEKPWKHR